jgi:hypothetical protein
LCVCHDRKVESRARTQPRRAGLLLAVVLLFGKPIVNGQVLTGEIDGVVRDTAGAVVPNAP